MHRALYFGIAGAIVLRVLPPACMPALENSAGIAVTKVLFLSVGYTVLNRLVLVKLVFGSSLMRHTFKVTS